ncbi:MAG: hypothetical protein K8H90_07865, partial [Thermoanaerobaculia bacterium]|nr:hypothetical protein [Thermoanaerobaculia bacterium]
ATWRRGEVALPAADVEQPVLWPRIAQRLKAAVGDEVFGALFAPLSVRLESPHEILLVAADRGVVETIERGFRLELESAAREEFDEILQVFVTSAAALSVDRDSHGGPRPGTPFVNGTSASSARASA